MNNCKCKNNIDNIAQVFVHAKTGPAQGENKHEMHIKLNTSAFQSNPECTLKRIVQFNRRQCYEQ